MDVIGHFGLAQDPFRPTIEPEQAYQSRPFSVARQQALAGLVRGARLIAVAGGTGAGKTLLLRDLERAVAGRHSVLRTERPDMAHAALSSAAEVLLIDDADTIDDATFAALIDRTTRAGGPAVVLACAQRCLDRLPMALGPLTVPLPFLAPDEARAFLVDRVTRAGGGAALFHPGALDLLADASRGIPAALRQLGAGALFQAAFDGAGLVEESHARQAAAMTQDMWRGVVAPDAAGQPPAAKVEAAAPPPVAPVEPIDRPERVEPANDDAPPARRGWWRGVPPLARLAIMVGLLLLSLPVIGYVVGAVKDERPAADSSYLSDDEAAEGEADAVPPEGELAEASNPGAVPIDAPPVEAPIETAGAPEDLTASTTVADEPPAPDATVAALPPTPEPTPREEEVAAVGDAPVAPPDVAPASGGTRVFVHYSTRQPGADEAAADVARELRERGFTVADIRAVPSSIETASVRYFFPTDRGDAESLHDALGVALRGRGFSAGDLKSMTGYRPSPRRGTLEVWVPAG